MILLFVRYAMFFYRYIRQLKKGTKRGEIPLKTLQSSNKRTRSPIQTTPLFIRWRVKVQQTMGLWLTVIPFVIQQPVAIFMLSNILIFS